MANIDRSSNILLLLAGPTAVGKTEVAINVAEFFNTDIISADSRQIYRELNIGTAKPTPDQLSKIKHHFIDERSIEDKFTVADFEQEAIQRLKELFEHRGIVVCAGGTGLYLRAITRGFDHIPDVDESLTRSLQEEFDVQGLPPLAVELKQLDPTFAAQGDMQNPHRVLRALAVCRGTGKPFSSFLKGAPKKRDFETVAVCLQRDRPVLYDRINLRVDQMMQNGLESEAQKLIAYKKHQALQTVGYAELFQFFEGNGDRDRAVELIKRNSRRYAKRQMTWFRNQESWNYLGADDEDLLGKIIKLVS